MEKREVEPARLGGQRRSVKAADLRSAKPSWCFEVKHDIFHPGKRDADYNPRGPPAKNNLESQAPTRQCPAMLPLLRNMLAQIAGVIAGVGCIFAGENLAGRVYPPPPGFDPKNVEMVKQSAAALPPSALLIVLLSYAVGFSVAVFVATRLAATNHAVRGAVVGAFFGAATVMNLMAFPHPVWFWAGNFAVLLAATWCGIRGGLPRPKL